MLASKSFASLQSILNKISMEPLDFKFFKIKIINELHFLQICILQFALITCENVSKETI